MEKSAVFSQCRKYRYVLRRIWFVNRPLVMFIGLNPSVADEDINDNTIRICINRAKSWGYGGIIMCNLFAYISTDPNELKKVEDPIGMVINDHWIIKESEKVDKIIACWGNGGSYLNRDESILKRFNTVFCLKRNKDGSPHHPLRLKMGIEPILFKKFCPFCTHLAFCVCE